MKVLITGGTGVIGEGVIEALLKRGHEIRLLSRHAADDARAWPSMVEGVVGDVGDTVSLTHKADGCELIIHIAGVASEQLPDVTFERVNVRGTANIISEARRAGVKRFIHISSLGAERGASAYHRSKLESERIVRESELDWTIIRPGNVYGPGDEVMSLMLKLVRSLPVIPVVDRGDQPFQPLWYGDMGEAVARIVDRDDLSGRILEVAGIEVTNMNEVISRLGKLTNRTPVQIPVPGIVAGAATAVAAALGIKTPVDENKLTMLLEGNTVEGENALVGTLQMTATPLDDGLRMLCDVVPEQLPRDGVGPLREKRFHVDIVDSTYNRPELFERFRNSFAETMPLAVHVEGSEPRRLTEGATISMKLPLRGNIQVRVEKVTSSTIVLSTIEGHPIAGFVRFDFKQHDGAIRFEVRVVDRSGTFFDLFAMETVGQMMQDHAWRTVVQRVLDDSGGTSVDGIVSEEMELSPEDVTKLEEWAEDVVIERKRKSREKESESRDESRT
jgi:NADH dehydrogenase